jgi:hypothetical protein
MDMTDYLCSFMYYSKQPQNLIYTNISIQYAIEYTSQKKTIDLMTLYWVHLTKENH